MKWIIFSIFFISCSLLDLNTNEKKYVELVWKILENASIQSWSEDKIITTLGKPKEKYVHKNKKESISWFYVQSETGLQEWALSLKNKKVDGVLYMPKDPYRSEFTIKKIMFRWKNLDCKHKKKQILRPGLIKIITYVGCDNDKRIIEYNRYKEVLSVTVEK